MTKEITEGKPLRLTVGFQAFPGTPYILGIILFFFSTLLSLATAKPVCLVVSGLALAVLGVRFRTLRARLSLPVVALLAVVLMDGISITYALSGKFALFEFMKVLSSVLMALMLLSLAPKGRKGGPFVSRILLTYAAFLSFISIDFLGTRYISGAVQAFLGLFTTDYMYAEGFEIGIRLTGLYANPNIFGGITGIGLILGLGLILNTESRGHRIAAEVLTAFTALAFMLAFSMGAFIAIFFALIVYLVFARKEKRGAAMVLLAELVIITALAGGAVSVTSLELWQGPRFVPLAATLVSGAALFLAHELLGRRLGDALADKSRISVILIAALAAAAAVFLLVAVNVTGPISLEAGSSLRRSAYPKPGAYTLTADADGAVRVKIVSQTRQETMMHTNTALYSGPLQGAAFTVPEGSTVIYLTFDTSEGAAIRSVTYEGPSSGSIALRYPLLPSFIANRLQGLFANENAIQRFVFFEDGIALFRRSPLIGSGLGAYENGIMSVQSFYYETKYAHNHYIQAMAETGIVGLLLFVGLLVSAYVCLIKKRLGPDAPQSAPMLAAAAAALVFMTVHAGVEVVFSFYSYLPMAFGAFMVISLTAGDSVPLPLGKLARNILLGVLAVLLLIFDFLLIQNIRAKDLLDKEPDITNVARAAEMDKFEWADYMLSYVYSVTGLDVPEDIHNQADRYAERLEKVTSNTIPVYLAQYYFSLGRNEDAFRMINKYVGYKASDSDAWDSAFNLIRVYFDGSVDYLLSAKDVALRLQQWSQENMGTLKLSPENESFVYSLIGE